MANLFASLNASSQSLAAFEKAIQVSQNNINNASTPGYAAQVADFTALSFDPNSGLAGGVSTSSSSTATSYLDSSVRDRLTNQGASQQQVSSLTGVESLFDVSGTSGIPAALSSLFSGFSALGVDPSSVPARQTVLTAAQGVATAFNDISKSLSNSSADADRQIQDQLNQINGLAAQIAQLNSKQQNTSSGDAGLATQLTNALEKLSSLANVSTRPSVNGGTDVLLDGQIPLVLGSQSFALHSAPQATSGTPSFPAGKAPTAILDQNGLDITSHLSGGSVAGLLQVRNNTLASIQGDTNQAGSLNLLAKSFADRVNSLLTAGVITEGPPVQSGVPLFTYDSSDATRTASSLAVATGFTPDKIAAIQPGAPSVSNGVALALANLAHGTIAADQIAGVSYTEYFGQLAGAVGSALAAKKTSADLDQQAVTQAQSLRSEISGVSLDAEAVRLTEFQKTYSASAKLIAILDQITQTTLDILQ